MTNGDHYYSPSPRAKHDPGEVTLKVAGRVLTLRTDSGVFSKERVDRGTRLLVEAMERGSVPLPPPGCPFGSRLRLRAIGSRDGRAAPGGRRLYG